MLNTEQMRAHGPDVRLEAHPSLGPDLLARIRAGLPVAIAGLGTVGSRLGMALATLGVPIYLIDSGRVEPANAGLQAYDLEDVGQTKCDALARRMHAVRGDLAVRCFPADVHTVGPGAALPVPAGDRVRRQLRGTRLARPDNHRTRGSLPRPGARRNRKFAVRPRERL